MYPPSNPIHPTLPNIPPNKSNIPHIDYHSPNTHQQPINTPGTGTSVHPTLPNIPPNQSNIPPIEIHSPYNTPNQQSNQFHTPSQTHIPAPTEAYIVTNAPPQARYRYKTQQPNPVTDFPTPEPIQRLNCASVWCSDSQYLDVHSCTCKCKDLVTHGPGYKSQLCSQNEVYDENICQCTPTTPVQAVVTDTKSCDMDVLFVIDSSCIFDGSLCDNRRKFIADMMESIMDNENNNIRVELIECTYLFGLQENIEFKDTFDIDFVNDNTQCANNFMTVPKKQCLEDAIQMFHSHDIKNLYTSYDNDREQKIIYIEMCGDNGMQIPCNQKLQIYNENIEIINVNIGASDPEYECVFWNGPYNLYQFNDF